MSSANADKMPGLRRRELTAMQVVKQLSTGQSRLPDWTREALAKVKPYGSGRLCAGGGVNQAATTMWRHESDNYKNLEKRPAEAGLFIGFGDGGGSITPFVFLPGLSRWPGMGADGADEQDYYLYPWNTLHQEGDGRSWAINNTSNLPGVECK